MSLFLLKLSRLDLRSGDAALNAFSTCSSASLLVAESAAIICEANRLVPATTLPSCSIAWAASKAASVASSCESRLADPRTALIPVCASIIAGAAAAAKAVCALRRASYCFWRWAAIPSRSVAAAPRLLMVSSMLLTVSPRAATTVLSAPSSMIWPSLSIASCWVSFIFLARSRSASSLPEASSAGPWLARLGLCAANCRLAARRGMSRPLRSSIEPPRCPSTVPAPALITMAMPAITAKAANRLPLTPHFGRRKPRPRNLPIVDRNAILSASRSLHLLDEFERQYRVTRLIKSGTFVRSAQILRIENKKAGARPAFPRLLSIRCGSVPRDHRATPVEAIVDASLDGMLVVAEPGADNDGGAGRERGAAEVVILVFSLGGPARGEHVFEAGANGVAVTVIAIGGEGHRHAARGYVEVVTVLPGITALGVKQRRAPGIAEPAGDRSKLIVLGGDQHAAREDHAVVVVVAQPAVLGFGTENPALGELIIGTTLHAAEEAAIVAGQAVVARERAADVTADIEAGPFVDRRGGGRSFGGGASRKIGCHCRRGRAERNEGHSAK